MLVSEILRIKGNALYTTAPDAPVLEAVKVMAQHDIGSLVVMDHGRMAGIVTFAEVLQRPGRRSRHAGRSRGQRRSPTHDPLTATPTIDVMELRRIDARAARALRAGDGRHDAAGRRVVPRRRQGGLRGAELREPDAEELHQRHGRETRRRASPRESERAPGATVRPAARTSPAASRSARDPRRATRATGRATTDSVASVRSAATHSRVAGRQVAASASSSAALRYGVSMKSCACPLRARVRLEPPRSLQRARSASTGR